MLIARVIPVIHNTVVDTTGFWTKFLMGVVEDARFAPDAPPEAYERLYE